MNQFTDLTAYEVQTRPAPAVSANRAQATLTAARRARRRHQLARQLRSVADRLDV